MSIFPFCETTHLIIDHFYDNSETPVNNDFVLAACNQMYWGSEKRSLKNQVEKPSNSLANKKYENAARLEQTHILCIQTKRLHSTSSHDKRNPPSRINNVTDMTTIINNSLSFHLHVSKSPKEKSYIFTKANKRQLQTACGCWWWRLKALKEFIRNLFC